MRTVTMCLSILQSPRFRIHTLVNFWSGNFNSWTRTYSKSSKLHGSIISGLEGGRSKKWTRRPVTTKTDEVTKKIHSCKPSIIRHETVDGTVSANATISINKTEINQYKQIRYCDVQQIIADNKDLANQVTVIAFDIETTGFSRDNDEIIEFALQVLEGGENSTFQTLVRPQRSITNSFVHGITNNMVRKPGVPRMEELIPILLQYVKSHQKPGGFVIWVAHNGRTFDFPFLLNEFSRCSIEPPPNWLYLDSLVLAREKTKIEGSKLSKLSLQTLREHYSIPLIGSAHRAMSDVYCLSMILQRLTYDLKLTIPGLVEKCVLGSDIKRKRR